MIKYNYKIKTNLFKEDDKVVCIKKRIGEKELKLYHTYTIFMYSAQSEVILRECGFKSFNEKQFVTLTEYKRMKLLKLKKNIKNKKRKTIFKTLLKYVRFL